jgi:hypothetical protein
LYKKFQKVASESKACELWKSEDDESRNRELDENQTILIKTWKIDHVLISISHTSANMKENSLSVWKFQKAAPGSRACELGENQKMMNREIENLVKMKPEKHASKSSNQR